VGGRRIFRYLVIILAIAIAVILPGEGAWALPSAKAVPSARTSITVSLTSVSSQARLGVAEGKVTGVPVALLELEKKQQTSWDVVAKGLSGQFTLSWGLPAVGGELTMRVVAKATTGTQSATSGSKTLEVAAAAGSPVTVSGKTVVIVDAAVRSAPAPGAAGTLVTSGGNLPAAGQIIVAQPGSRLPNGFIGLATSVKTDGAIVDTATTPVSLLQAVPTGSLDTTAGPAADAAAGAMIAAVLAKVVKSSVTCTGSTSVTTTTSTSFSTGLKFSASWSDGSVTSASVIASASAQLSITDSIKAKGSCTLKSRTIATFPGPAVDAWVGYVPVIVTSTIKIAVSGKATASATASASISGGATATAGIRWTPDQGATPVAALTPNFSATAPRDKLTASVTANVIPSISVLVDGLAGTTLTLTAGLSLSAATCGDPAWKIALPVQFQGQLTVPALGLKTKKITLFKHSYTLASGGPACSGGGGGGGGDGSPSATISFSYGDPAPTSAEVGGPYWFWTQVTPAANQSLTGSLYVISLPNTTTCPATAEDAMKPSDAIPATQDDMGVPLGDVSEEEFATSVGAIVPGPQVTCAYAADSPDAKPYATGQSITTTIAPANLDGPDGQFGMLTGQVTDATTGDPIGGVNIDAITNVSTDGGVSYPGIFWAMTDNAGDYAIVIIPENNYRVLFGDDLGGPDYTPTYTPCSAFCGFEEQWYVDEPTFDTGALVSISALGTTSGINGALTPIPVDNPDQTVFAGRKLGYRA
jgi:hypothetical protein